MVDRAPGRCLVMLEAPRQLGEGALWPVDLREKGNLQRMSTHGVHCELTCSNRSMRLKGSPHFTERSLRGRRASGHGHTDGSDASRAGPQRCVNPDPGGWDGRFLWKLEPACCVELETGFVFLEEAVLARAAPGAPSIDSEFPPEDSNNMQSK